MAGGGALRPAKRERLHTSSKLNESARNTKNTTESTKVGVSSREASSSLPPPACIGRAWAQVVGGASSHTAQERLSTAASLHRKSIIDSVHA